MIEAQSMQVLETVRWDKYSRNDTKKKNEYQKRAAKCKQSAQQARGIQWTGV